MSTRSVLGSIFASAGILVIGWQAGTAVNMNATNTTASSGTTGASTTATGTGTTGSGSSTDSGATATPSTTSGAADGTFTGTDVDTRFGSVQVRVTISGGAISDVTAVQLTDHDQRSVSISNRAAPVLRSEVLSAQSANVNTVGGATYTSDAYLTSLQAALDQAGF